MVLHKICSQCQKRNPVTVMHCKCGHLLDAYRKEGTGADPSPTSTPMRPVTHRVPASQNRKQATHYIARYWRGELSLAHSFWIANCGLDLVTTLIDTFLENRQETSSSPLRIYQLSTVFTFLYICLLGPWQLVGLWRAARQYVADTSSPIWGRCAQGVVIIGFLFIPLWIPTLSERAKIAIGTEDYRYTVALSDDGNMLRVDGGITTGLTHTITEQLNRHPQVELIVLNSHIGLLEEGWKLQTLIEQRGLSTYTDRQCEGICTTVFLAGAQRMLQADAHLGFHKVKIAGVPDSLNQAENNDVRDYMLKQGVQQGFVDAAVDISSDEVWIPTTDELIEAGVVTEIVDGNQTVVRPQLLSTGGGQ